MKKIQLNNKRRLLPLVLIFSLILGIIVLVNIIGTKKDDSSVNSKNNTNKNTGALKKTIDLEDGADSIACQKLNQKDVNSIFKEPVEYKKGLTNSSSNNIAVSSCIVITKQKDSSKMLSLLVREYPDEQAAQNAFRSINGSVKTSQSKELDINKDNVFNVAANQLTLVSEKNVFTLTLSNFNEIEDKLVILGRSI